MSEQIGIDAPVMCVDLSWPFESIWPCEDCTPWHVEMLTTDDDKVFVRHWHAAGCLTLATLLGRDT